MKFTKRKEIVEWGRGNAIAMSDAISQAEMKLGDLVQVSVTEANVIIIEKVKKRKNL